MSIQGISKKDNTASATPSAHSAEQQQSIAEGKALDGLETPKPHPSSSHSILKLSTTSKKTSIKSEEKPKAKKTILAVCPIVVRQQILTEKLIAQAAKGKAPIPSRFIKVCNCSSTEPPNITDVEFYKFVESHITPEQILVVCITSSEKGKHTKMEKSLRGVYERANKARRKPCLMVPSDPYRIVKYDLATANRDTKTSLPLLVMNHQISEGMAMMYLNGKLVFCNNRFNGYETNERDFFKQMEQTRQYAQNGFHLPDDFNFGSKKRAIPTVSVNANARSLTSDVVKEILQKENIVSRK